ncbi:OLC1v1004964C1 [Oldenlandia corymbosa var. corymbosa]|uniref:OLC1v1004964C1 n=1 Tax=Oldenlandia corymbosa var. corymbosa TaxID=529605 RepID=A0AAV1DH00_OLDCO|nr:OLC1v1004964C1 [Oldenlandia corymbosa var. corymbosa]
MAFDRVKAATHGVKPGDVSSLQPTEKRVIVHFKSDARQLSLGPNFPSAPENLKEYILFLNPESTYYKYENPCKFENWERLRVWPWSDKPEIHKAFVHWYYQLEPEYADTWRMAGIYDLLKFCTIGLGKSRDLVEAVLRFWSESSNVFCFPWGPMTPTLLDVCVITGLPVVADVAVDGNVTDDDAIAAAAGQSRSYGPFINENKGHTSRLASGVQMNLAEAILAMLYHCLHEARHNPGATFCGPNTRRLGREKLTMSQYTMHRELMDLRDSSGYEAIKTSFGIGKFAKNKSVGGVAETEKKGKRKSGVAAKTGGQSSKKSIATAAVRARTSTRKDAPTSTRRPKRLIGRKRSTSEVSNKKNPVSVSESEEEEAESPGREKGSAAVAEDQTAQKIVRENGGSRSKRTMKTASSSAPTTFGKKAPPSLESLKARLERTKATSYVKTEETSSVPEMPLGAGQLKTNIKEAIAAKSKAKEELEKAQAKRKQLEAELSGVVANTDVALDAYGQEVGTAPDSPMPVTQTPPSHPEVGATAEERQTTLGMPQDVTPPEEEAIDVAPLASRPSTPLVEI